MEVMKKIYLAVPYAVSPQRAFRAANQTAARLMLEGNIVFSPISHGHHIADHLPHAVRTDSDWWMKYERPHIEWADEVYVICIGDKGMEWIERSKGVQNELAIAAELGKPVRYTQYDD